MEVTKWLKPSVMRVTTYGDSASVQAVTRVNAEQASKRPMCCRALKTDQPCALKIDQGWKPWEVSLGVFRV